ncbi:MAG: cation:proton antiporter [Thermosphaera sp.]
MSSYVLLYVFVGIMVLKIVGAYFKTRRVGELAGYILASIILALFFYGSVDPKELELIAEISSILIVFHAGLTSDFSEVLGNLKKALFISVTAVGFTFAIIFSSLYYLGLPLEVSLMIAILFSNTATETTALVLEKLGLELKNLLISASFIDDVIVLFLAIVYFNLLRGVGYVDLITSLSISIGVFALVLQLGMRRDLVAGFFAKISKSYETFVDSTILILTGLVVLFIIFKGSGLIAGYLAGLFLSMGSSIKDPFLRFRSKIIDFSIMLDSFIDSMFIPMFLLYVSLFVIKPGINMFLVVVVFTGAVIGKFIPYFFFMFRDKRFKNNAVLAGICMSGRGVLEMVLVIYAMNLGLLHDDMVNTVLAASVLTSLFAMISTSGLHEKMRIS